MVIFQLNARIEKKTSKSIQKRRVMEHTIPSLVTGTPCPKITAYRNHGSGSLMQNASFSYCILLSCWMVISVLSLVCPAPSELILLTREVTIRIRFDLYRKLYSIYIVRRKRVRKLRNHSDK